MQSRHHDLSTSSYILLAFVAICQEAVGLKTALILGAGLVVVWAVLSPLVTLAVELRRNWPTGPFPPK